MAMKPCPNCNKLGLFVHDGSLAKCVHPDHDSICAAINAEKEREAAEAKRLATMPSKTKCTSCACYAWIRPGQFTPAEDFTPDNDGPISVRCELHRCLAAGNMEIGIGGQCDGCMKVFCTKCDRCKCYRSTYSVGRCKHCLDLHRKNPSRYPLQPAFPDSNNTLVVCNICQVNERKRGQDAEKKRVAKRKAAVYFKINEGGPRVEKRIKLYLRKWKAECVRDNLEPRGKEASQRLSLIKGFAGYYASMVSWKRLAINFFKTESEKNRVYDKDSIEGYINIPIKFRCVSQVQM